MEDLDPEYRKQLLSRALARAKLVSSYLIVGEHDKELIVLAEAYLELLNQDGKELPAVPVYTSIPEPETKVYLETCEVTFIADEDKKIPNSEFSPYPIME